MVELNDEKSLYDKLDNQKAIEFVHFNSALKKIQVILTRSYVILTNVRSKGGKKGAKRLQILIMEITVSLHFSHNPVHELLQQVIR